MVCSFLFQLVSLPASPVKKNVKLHFFDQYYAQDHVWESKIRTFSSGASGSVSTSASGSS